MVAGSPEQLFNADHPGNNVFVLESVLLKHFYPQHLPFTGESPIKYSYYGPCAVHVLRCGHDRLCIKYSNAPYTT